MVATNFVDRAQEGMSYAQAATFVPRRNGKRVHASTVMRWANDGVRGPNGERVRLATLRVGGRRLVTLAALEQFLATLNADSDDSTESSAEAAHRHFEVRRALKDLGI